MNDIRSTFSYFWYFLLFNLCFFVLQLILLFSENGSFISSMQLPKNTYLELIEVLILHISLNIILSTVQVLLLLGLLNRRWHYFSCERWQIIIWAVFISALISANLYYFPLSLLSKTLAPLCSNALITTVLYFSLSLIALMILNSLFCPKVLYTLLLIIPIVVCFFVYHPVASKDPQQDLTKPNIIILGIDSLNPDNITEHNMPFLYNLLKEQVQFTNAISPLARTYPAWNSILTGLYAQHHQATENLIAKNLVHSKASIAWQFVEQGYNTVYATDDRRFNSIDQEYGFQTVIGPKLGVNDIILGSFNDFALTNLLINLPCSAWFLPYNFINRASYFSYYPHTFNLKLNHEIALLNRNQPLFLAVHFTLPHWPYAWAESSPEELNNEFSLKKRASLYQKSLTGVDKQFQSFFNYLQEQGYFKNTLLIVLSDHGEVLYYPGSRKTSYRNYQGIKPSRFAKYIQQNTATALNKSAGHGSDILSPGQYHSMLAFAIYQKGKKISKNHQINQRVALIDLAPTILDYTFIKHNIPMDGISLLPSIRDKKYSLSSRSFFIESGMFPNQRLSKEKIRDIGRTFYKVNPSSGQLEIKSDKRTFFDEQRLYGIIKDDWVLALYPDKHTYIPILQNLFTGAWSDDWNSRFVQQAPASELYTQLKQFYGKKLLFSF